MSGQQWLIRVNGSEQMRVDDGNTVLIGRKPLRPMAAIENTLRLDIVDRTKSMSKVHARLTVHDNGAATIADLGSTNGTWVINADGSLHRIPEQTEFVLADSTMRFQFGDVPVDFIRVESEVSEPVADLFSYAGSQARSDQQTPNLSVDDILDIRAGEPTGLLNTTKVRNSIAALHDGAIQDIAAHKAAAAEAVEQSHIESMRSADGNAGMHGSNSDNNTLNKRAGSDANAAGATNLSSAATSVVNTHGGADFSSVSADHDQESSLPLTPQGMQPVNESDSRDLFADAAAVQQAEQIQSLNTVRAQPSDTSVRAQPTDLMNDSHSADTAFSADHSANLPDNMFRRHDYAEAQAANHAEHVDTSDTVANSAKSVNASAGMKAAEGAFGSTSGQANTSASVAVDSMQRSVSGEQVAAQEAQSTGSYETGYQPVYAPGSVLDRLAKQDAAQDTGIEVDGYSSKDAMTTTDFAVQFEIAQRPQLVPYLAMNPSLYDDLYAWLEAQGNADIDRALQANKGYNSYRSNGK